MIAVLGIKRVFIIAVLAGLSAFFAVVHYQYLVPQKASVERELSRLRSDTADKQQKASEIRANIDRFSEQKQEFENLQALGFFDTQDRIKARESVHAVQKMSGVLSAQYTIGSVQINSGDNKKPEEEEAAEAGYKILTSEIEVHLTALDDLDIYRFIYLMNYGFPGHVTIKDLSISRTAEVSQPILRAIGSNKYETMVEALLKLDWRVMTPEGALDMSAVAQGLTEAFDE